jgi:hypothetical protein
MKYLITENRLNNIIFKYLDVKYGALEQKKGVDYDIVFAFPGEKYGVLGWKKIGDLYVYYKINYFIIFICVYIILLSKLNFIFAEILT